MKPLITCAIAGLQYLIHPQKLGSIQETINRDAIIPVTLLTTTEIFDDLDAILRLFDFYDDVFVPEFGSILVEKPEGEDAKNFSSLLDTGRVREIYRLDEMVLESDDLTQLPSGPYFLHGPNVHQAWRLHDDELEAFTYGVIPDDVNQPDEYYVLNSLSLSGAFKTIPIPSRLYHPPPSLKKPLSGLRISISDTISLRGTGTTFSSKAWQSLYSSTVTTTATYARKLVDMGAVIVGKTKTSQFGTGQEWIDERAPWSSRADGYQEISGASVGAVSGLSGYEWLKYAIGVNSGPKEGRPESGLYSLVPSSGSVPLEGIKTTPRNGQIRLFSRNIDDLVQLSRKSTDAEAVKYPKRLIYPTDLHTREYHELVNDFLAALENFLGVKTEKLSLDSLWDRNPPTEAANQGMQVYMEKAPFLSWCFDYYHAFDDLRATYEKKFDRRPYIEASPRFFWEAGANVTKDDQDVYLRRVETYRQWFQKNVMAIDNGDFSDAVLILPCGTPTPQYRDEPAGKPKAVNGITAENLAQILNVPALTIPFAQLPYDSRISGKTEYQPVCASLLGAHGSDSMLIQLAKQAFELAQWRIRVDTGHLAFPVGDNSRNVNDEHRQPVLQDQSLSDEL